MKTPILHALATAALIAAGSSARAAEGDLTPAQTELIELMSLMQIAAAACEYRVDTQVLAVVARKERLTLKSPAEEKLIARAMADARARFTPQKRGVECLVLLDEYGPRGTRVAGLLSKP